MPDLEQQLRQKRVVSLKSNAEKLTLSALLLAKDSYLVGAWVLVDAVVGEVGEDVWEWVCVGGVGVGGEPDEAVVVEEDPQGWQRRQQDVDPQVVLGVVDQVRLGHILLDN